ncbi:Hypothetical_protein [Hexamita inflata]|uniref:Hypothetical_protein n=1 Tax=Hexamita inflata TaxID=28002 RepID=A0AA86R3D5_9EUKA|nr:Hypothetical protein HINF_LOCUS58639 [Hexamita inflata]
MPCSSFGLWRPRTFFFEFLFLFQQLFQLLIAAKASLVPTLQSLRCAAVSQLFGRQFAKSCDCNSLSELSSSYFFLIVSSIARCLFAYTTQLHCLYSLSFALHLFLNILLLLLIIFQGISHIVLLLQSLSSQGQHFFSLSSLDSRLTIIVSSQQLYLCFLSADLLSKHEGLSFMPRIVFIKISITSSTIGLLGQILAQVFPTRLEETYVLKSALTLIVSS